MHNNLCNSQHIAATGCHPLSLPDQVLGGLAPEVVAYEPPPPATGGRQAGQATGTYTFAFAKYSATFTLKFSIEAMGDGTVRGFRLPASPG